MIDKSEIKSGIPICQRAHRYTQNANVHFEVFYLCFMYRCESWTIKKAECPEILCFQFVVLKKTLESPLDCKEIKPVNPKGNQL